MSQTPNQTQTKPKIVEYAEKLLIELDEKAKNGDTVAMNSIMLVREFIDNVNTPKTHLKIADSLNTYLRRLLPKTVRKVIAIKQHLSDLYRSGYHVDIITSYDCIIAGTIKSYVRVERYDNIIEVEFKRKRDPEIVESVELVLNDSNIAKDVFQLIKETITRFKNDTIDYKLISLIVKNSVSEYSYSMISYLS
jgi:hypothetical protein